MEKQSVFKRLAEKFSECHAEIKSNKEVPKSIESLISEAGEALNEAISSKAIEFEDAPNWFGYVPKKKVKSGGKRKAWDIYWLNRIYWILTHRREIFPNWPDNEAAELLWTVQTHPDRIADSLEKTILHTKLVVMTLFSAGQDQCRKEEIRRSSIINICLDLTSLCEDVCLYLAHMLTCRSESAGTEPTSHLCSKSVFELITQGESHTLEFKETLQYCVKTRQVNSDVLHSSLKTIAAFLNTDGGTLLIGVNDSGQVKGIKRDLRAMNRANIDRFQLKIRNELSARFSPLPLGQVDVAFKELPEGTICRVDVQPLPKPQVIHFDNDVYVRDGNRTIKLEGAELTNWIQQRAN